MFPASSSNVIEFLSLSLSQPVQVNISELGLVTQSGKVVWGEFNIAIKICSIDH